MKRSARTRCGYPMVAGAAAVMAISCATTNPGTRLGPPEVVAGEDWRAEPPVGHEADALRRNLPPGDSLSFGELRIRVEATISAHDAEDPSESAEEPAVAVLSLRTLHHSGSPQPLRPQDDPVELLRGLQRWGRTDRNWWDVPYHFLIDLEGRIYEGRDWRYLGETNTAYDPRGHLLISVIGNYDQQEATPEQLTAITKLMAWAVADLDVPVDRIGGHYDYAATSCPGTHLTRYLEDGTFRRGVEAVASVSNSD